MDKRIALNGRMANNGGPNVCVVEWTHCRNVKGSGNTKCFIIDIVPGKSF
jgi:hypothetical protein